MDTNYTVVLSYETVVPDIPMTGIIESGQGPPAVDGTVELPQGGEVASKSFGRNTVYEEGSEPGSHVLGDFETMWNSVLPGLAKDCFNDLENVEARLQDLQVFGTNLLKNRYMAVAGEYTDNANETAAFNTIVEGAHVVINISGNIPTMDDIKNQVIEEVTNKLGGMFV